MILEDPSFFVGITLPKNPKTVQNSCIRKFSMHSLARTYAAIYTKTLFCFVATENVAQFYGGVTNSSE